MRRTDPQRWTSPESGPSYTLLAQYGMASERIGEAVPDRRARAKARRALAGRLDHEEPAGTSSSGSARKRGVQDGPDDQSKD
jgi:hypothetical protein